MNDEKFGMLCGNHIYIVRQKGMMMKLGTPLTLIGIAMIVIAWILAASIPKAANSDFNRLVRNAGGMSHTPNFSDAYKQMSANRRMLQNFYVGAAGLIFLAAGLMSMIKNTNVEQSHSGDTVNRAPNA